jgi:hypothetical protein
MDVANGYVITGVIRVLMGMSIPDADAFLNGCGKN